LVCDDFGFDEAALEIAVDDAGLIFSIAWSIAAVREFGADVQTSAQTGFTIGSYIVTAGMLFHMPISLDILDRVVDVFRGLLVALVAFVDTRYEERM